MMISDRITDSTDCHQPQRTTICGVFPIPFIREIFGSIHSSFMSSHWRRSQIKESK